MNRAYRAIAVGIGLVLSSIGLDLAGSALQSLLVLVISFALGIAGAVVAIRGMIDFISERA
jgi:hypothetical protein